MSYSKAWVSEETNRTAVLSLYRSREMLTVDQIADLLDTSYHNVSHVLKTVMPEAERKALAKIRYSASKSGDKNPMQNKKGEEHPRWVGECEDGKGYLTCMHEEQRIFVHHLVLMQALGLSNILEGWEVHHIDNDTRNNTIENLALTTKAGHRHIHYLQATDSLQLRLKKSSIADALKYMT